MLNRAPPSRRKSAGVDPAVLLATLHGNKRRRFGPQEKHPKHQTLDIQIPPKNVHQFKQKPLVYTIMIGMYVFFKCFFTINYLLSSSCEQKTTCMILGRFIVSLGSKNLKSVRVIVVTVTKTKPQSIPSRKRSHIPPWEKEHDLQIYLGWGYVCNKN